MFSVATLSFRHNGPGGQPGAIQLTAQMLLVSPSIFITLTGYRRDLHPPIKGTYSQLYGLGLFKESNC